MKRWSRSVWLWLAVVLAAVLGAGFVSLRHSTINIMHPALDKLSAVTFEQRWSHPEMLRLRALGAQAVPPLRRVLGEKDQPVTRFLLWVKRQWPGVTKFYSHFPDPAKLTERRQAACQVLQTLGPAGRTAAPELIHVLRGKDLGDLNAATMALWAIGPDAEMCDRLDTVLEHDRGLADSARCQMFEALGRVKPPSPRTLKVLAAALSDPSSYVQCQAAEAIGCLRVRTPELVSALKTLQATTTNELTVVAASAALWEVDGDATLALPPVFKVLQAQLGKPDVLGPGGNAGRGQSVTAADQAFMGAGELFRTMNLGEPDRSKALALLAAWGNQADHIFVRMLLLPAMMDLGFPNEKCLAVCRTGLSQHEDYYRLQAAELLAQVCAKYPASEVDLDTLVRDRDVGVRVYAAQIHWRRHRQTAAVVPVLTEALDRSKHQSYYYAQTLPVALAGLRDIGPEARDATTALEKILTDPDPATAKLAAEALAKIRGDLWRSR